MEQRIMPTNILSSLPLIALSIAMGVSGQTMIKLGTLSAANLPAEPVARLLLVLRSPWVLLGLMMYGIGALSWVVVLSRLDLSIAYPFLALNFVLVALISWLLLGESIPGLRWVGIGCICVGIFLIARSTAA